MFKKIKIKCNNLSKEHGVNPVVFTVLYIGTSPFFLYFLYLVIVNHEHTERFLLYLIIDLLIFVLPFAYVLIFGKNFTNNFLKIFWIVLILIAIISFRELWSLLLI